MTKRLVMLGMALLSLFCMTAAAQTWASTGNTVLSLNIPVRAELIIGAATTPLMETVEFGNLTGHTDYAYRIRTSRTSGTGAITFTIADFSPADADGPKVTQLEYTTTAGAAANSTVTTAATPSTGSSNAVAGFGSNARTTGAGQTGAVNWVLKQPSALPYPANQAYTSAVTFTISVT